MRATFKIINEVPETYEEGEYTLFLQWGILKLENGEEEKGYRFIWRKPTGELAPKASAIIQTSSDIFKLIGAACEKGWFINCEK